MSDLKLLSAKEYLVDLTKHINRAKDHVYILDLVLADDSTTRPLVNALEAAAKRGIKVNVAIDTFTYGELGGFFSPFKRHSLASKKVTAMVTRFEKAGVRFHWLSDRHKLNPFAGVTHIKWSIVDSTSYCFGGTNLYKRGIDESVDYMFKITDPTLSETLRQEHEEIIHADETSSQYDGAKLSTNHGTLLIDTGKRNESLIYDRACELAEKAKHIIFVSQYCPNGKLSHFLKDSRSEVYYNRPELASFLNSVLIRTTLLQTGIQTKYTQSTYIHAKFMLFEMENGEQISLTGSHNFSYSGVRFGTREVALESNNPAVYQQLKNFWKKNIK